MAGYVAQARTFRSERIFGCIDKARTLVCCRCVGSSAAPASVSLASVPSAC